MAFLEYVYATTHSEGFTAQASCILNESKCSLTKISPCVSITPSRPSSSAFSPFHHSGWEERRVECGDTYQC